MADFIPVPKKNIWLAAYDVRPQPASSRPAFEFIVDLRVPRQRTRKAPRAVFLPALSFDAKWILFAASRVGAAFIAVLILYAGVRGAGQFVARKGNEATRSFREVALLMEEGESAARAFHFSDAESRFEEAANRMVSAKEELGAAYGAMARVFSLLPDSLPLGKVPAALEVFMRLPARAAKLAGLFRSLEGELPELVFEGSYDAHAIFREIDQELERTAGDLKKAGEISSDLRKMSAAYAPSLGALLHKIPLMLQDLEEKREALAMVHSLLDEHAQKTYLFLFQNPAEIRPTGGFIGSYGVMRLEGGKIAEFFVDNIYNPDGQLKQNVLPPRPLLRITPGWGARDANWFFDFARSAEKVAEFLEETTEFRPDGVVAVNPPVIARLLGAAGPIEMPEYDKVITAENLWEEMQIQTRQGPDFAIGQPKRFLTLFGPRLLAKMKSMPRERRAEAARIFGEALEEKDIQIYFRDSRLQKFVEENGWGGRVAEAQYADYLAIVHTNIGGAKTDYVMRQEVELLTEIEPDGGIVNTLSLKRFHDGARSKYWWWNAKSYDYVRIYVPQGSRVISSSGAEPEPKLVEIDREAYRIDQDIGILANPRPVFAEPGKHLEIFEESGKTVFAGWMIIPAGKSAELRVTYRVPLSTGFATPSYALYFQKQSGVRHTLLHRLSLPEGAKINYASEGYDEKTSAWPIADVLRDIRRGIAFAFPAPAR